MSRKIDKPAICYETGLDEAFLLGTRDELSEFAHSILQLLDKANKEIEYCGVNALSASNETSLTYAMSDVVIDGLIIIKSEEDQRTLMNKIRTNNGELPID